MALNARTATTKTALEKLYYDLGEREFRKIYTQQRAIAQKRLNRLRGSDFSNTEFVQNYDKNFPKLGEINTSRDLIFQMSEINRFVSSPRSTISGQKEIRARTVETLQSRGYDVDNSNYNDFNYFIQRAREMGLFGHMDSDQIIDDVWESVSDSGKEKINKALRAYRKKHEGAISRAKKKRRKEAAKRAKRKKR